MFLYRRRCFVACLWPYYVAVARRILSLSQAPDGSEDRLPRLLHRLGPGNPNVGLEVKQQLGIGDTTAEGGIRQRKIPTLLAAHPRKCPRFLLSLVVRSVVRDLRRLTLEEIKRKWRV